MSFKSILSLKQNKNKKKTIMQQQQKNEIVVTDQGTISLTSMIFIDKRYGNFFVRDAVIVEPEAYIGGAIMSTKMVIKGHVEGDITCKEELVIESTANIKGNIIANTTFIEPGAVINGSLLITENVPCAEFEKKISYAEKLLIEGYGINNLERGNPSINVEEKSFQKYDKNTNIPRSENRQSVFSSIDERVENAWW